MKKTIRDVNVRGRCVLVRVDFNVPLEGGKVLDDTRIRASLPTIRYLLEQRAKVVLMSHLGRPKGVDENLRLDPVAQRLQELLEKRVLKTSDCIGKKVEGTIAAMAQGEVLLLENLRFHPEEEQNDPQFALKLARLGDIYVNDAFGSAHRAHASTEGIAHFCTAVAGFLMEKELAFLGKALDHPERPFVAILGGAKISDKIGVIRNLLPKVDALLIGGGLANNFMAAKGIPLGESLIEKESIKTAQEILRESGEKIHLPEDAIAAKAFSGDAEAREVSVKAVPKDWRIMDIGSATIQAFTYQISKARTVVWNGPLGVFEYPRFAMGTFAIARALGKLKGTTIVGGGETAAAVEQAGVASKLTHISTGGGASLEFLEGRTLPGVAVLQDA